MDTISNSLPEYDPYTCFLTPENESPLFPDETDAPENNCCRDPVADVAKKFFSLPYLYPWQRIVIANILDAAYSATAEEYAKNHFPESGGEQEVIFRDEDGFLRGRQIVILPTGAGKSMCFQIPAMMLPGPTLVIYPLLALMHDQVAKLRAVGIEPVLFKGGQTDEERNSQFQRLENKDASIIITNPEILADKYILGKIKESGLSHIAIDEAHCVSEWGDTFRPAYLNLGNIIGELSPQVVTAFTATASPDVLERITEVLFNGKTRLIRGSSDRENIIYSVKRCTAKDPALIKLIAESERPVVIFCGTRGRTQRLAALLQEYFQDDNIKYYHAGLLREEKIKTENWFSQAASGILCSTCAWGMGVDIKNIRTVIHYDSPPTVEAYIQEAGRGGRDGLQSKAILLWNDDDRKKIETLQEPAKSRASVLTTYAESGRCRRSVLLEALGECKSGEPSALEGEKEKACAGCDVCNRNAVFFPKEEALAEIFVRRNKRRYTILESSQILCEKANLYTRNHYGKNIWQTKDFMDILKKLQKENKIIFSSFVWKGKLTVPSIKRHS